MSGGGCTREHCILVCRTELCGGSQGCLGEVTGSCTGRCSCRMLSPLSYGYDPSSFMSLFGCTRRVVAASFRNAIFNLVFGGPVSIFYLGSNRSSHCIGLLGDVKTSSFLGGVKRPVGISGIGCRVMGGGLRRLGGGSVRCLGSL